MGATFRKRGKSSWLVTVHTGGQRQFKTVRSQRDAEDLVRYIHRQEAAGINVVEAYRQARAAAPAPTAYPALKDALPEWIDAQLAAKEFRGHTANIYRSRLNVWVFPHAVPDGRLLGDIPVDQVTREMLGAVIQRARAAGRSRTLVAQLRNPLRSYYRGLIETKALVGPNPAGDLKFFMGRRQKAKQAGLVYFEQEEGPKLIEAAKALYPRWTTFILTGLLAGLRWGESAALHKADIDWTRGLLRVRRTVSGDNTIAMCKDGEGRHVKASPALIQALREQVAAVELEGQVKEWTPEQRELVFPNAAGRHLVYAPFVTNVWRPLLKRAGLPYRKYHSTRHTFATWLLSDGADLRWVQKQLGHASVTLTIEVYGHLQPERHEAAVEGLDRYVS